MKRPLLRLSQRYVAGLRAYLKPGPSTGDLQPARKLGGLAVALGVETLELAKIHEHTFALLKLSSSKNRLAKRARIFFLEANSLIEETHLTVRQSKARLSRIMAALGRRTEELAISSRQLRQGAEHRKNMEVDFAKRRKYYEKCLEESLKLQKHLRQLAHQVLAAQEEERKKISRMLQNEVAQNLLGINVRLLSLKVAAQTKSKGLKNEIASTQQLVASSARSVRRVGREIGNL